MTTTFDKNVKLNLAFGNQAGDVTKPDFDRIRNQSKLVLEELRELLQWAYFDHDVVLELKLTPKSGSVVYDRVDIMRQIMDAQGDITTVNDGVAHIAGFDGDECLQRVYASNMSKFIRSEDEVAPALQHYYDLGFVEGQLRIEGEFPQACIKVVDTVEVGGKEYPAGKFLKNMAAFKEPDFEDMLTKEPQQQIKNIVVSSVVQAGNIQVMGRQGAAIVSPDFIQFLAPLAKSGMEFFHDNKIESYVPVYHIDASVLPELPQLWGDWKADAREYLASPIRSSITGLTRID